MQSFPAKVSHLAGFFVLAVYELKMLEEAILTGPTGQKSESNVPEAEESMSTSQTHPMDEVFRVNQLLQIEDLDWTCQLKQVVNNFLI